jgi:hypothetical protein
MGCRRCEHKAKAVSLNASTPRKFLLPPRADGPIVMWSGMLGGVAGLAFLLLMRRSCVTSGWWILGGGGGVTVLGFGCGRIASLARAELSSVSLRTWKWWSFGTPETVDLSTAIAVEVLTKSLPAPFSAKRYWLRVSFSDRPDRALGPWLPGSDARSVRKLFDSLAQAIREQIACKATTTETERA